MLKNVNWNGNHFRTLISNLPYTLNTILNSMHTFYASGQNQ